MFESGCGIFKKCLYIEEEKFELQNSLFTYIAKLYFVFPYIPTLWNIGLIITPFSTNPNLKTPLLHSPSNTDPFSQQPFCKTLLSQPHHGHHPLWLGMGSLITLGILYSKHPFCSCMTWALCFISVFFAMTLNCKNHI